MSDRHNAHQLVRCWRARGASLMELVMVLTIIGILSAYAVPKILPSANKTTAAYQAHKLADNLRHTRMLALAWGKALKFKTDSASYRVVCSNAAACNNRTPAAASCPNPTAVVIDHGHHGPFCIALENSVILVAPAELEFDILGRPVTAVINSYQFFAGSTLMATVSVTPVTGFISTVVLQ